MKVDEILTRISNYVTGTISSFVAFLFFLFALGAIYGALIVSRYPHLGIYLIIAPALVGLIAYYSRTFSLIIFAGVVLFFLIL